MRSKYLGALGTFLFGAGLALAQTPAPSAPPAAMPQASGPVIVQPAMPAYGAPSCGACCPEPPCRSLSMYGGAEFLVWRTKEFGLPPLATTGPLESAGIIGENGTQIILGAEDTADETRFGGRFTLGAWVNAAHNIGVEGTYFFLARAKSHGVAASAGDTLLAIPTVDEEGEFSIPIAGPDVVPGGAFPVPGLVGFSNTTRLSGLELNGRARLWQGDGFHLDFLAGFRYLDLEDDLAIEEAGFDPFTGSAALFVNADNFNTRNRFGGGQLGLEAEVSRGRLFVNILGKAAFGINTQELRISATSTDFFLATGRFRSFPTGIFAQNSFAITDDEGNTIDVSTGNTGTHTHNAFSVVPQIAVKVGYNVTDHLRAYAGYDFLYANHVIRPGDQIDRNLLSIDHPAVRINQTDFWAQGLTFGLEFNY